MFLHMSIKNSFLINFSRNLIYVLSMLNATNRIQIHLELNVYEKEIYIKTSHIFHKKEIVQTK